jgi:hypothetical protein
MLEAESDRQDEAADAIVLAAWLVPFVRREPKFSRTSRR